MRVWGECLVKFRTCSLAIPYAFLRMNVPRVIAGLNAENVQLSTVLADGMRHDVLDAPPRVSVAHRRNFVTTVCDVALGYEVAKSDQDTLPPCHPSSKHRWQRGTGTGAEQNSG
jgi:hypothetical protein